MTAIPTDNKISAPAASATPPPTDRNLDAERLALERERLELGKRQLELEQKQLETMRGNGRTSVLAKEHVTAIVTGMVSFAAVCVSLTQVWIANITKNTELEVARQQQEREWRYKGLEFITHNADSFFGADKAKREHLSDALIVAFPPEVAASLLKNLQQAANNADQQGTFMLAESKMHRKIPKH